MTEAEDIEEDEEDLEDTEDIEASVSGTDNKNTASVSGTASNNSSKSSGSGSSSKSGGAASCDHEWEEVSDLDTNEDYWICVKCGTKKAASGSGSGAASASTAGSGSGGSGGSSKSGTATTCDHDWVATKHEATGHYESVCVQEAYDLSEKVGSHYVCNNCGFASTDTFEMVAHTSSNCDDCGYHTEYIYETVHHDAVYENQWVEDTAAYTTYKCSKCGATK